MQVEALALRLRPRSALEAADLGVRLTQSCARQVYGCYALVWIPVAIVACSMVEVAGWAPALILWWLKPWMDRTILFVLSRAAFAQPTSPLDLWRAQRTVWWQQLLATLTLRRLSPWRAFTQPVYQLEGLSLRRIARRVMQLRRGRTGAVSLMASGFSLAETALALALFWLAIWLVPGQDFGWSNLFAGETTLQSLVSSLLYAFVVLFLEPFYVGAGFAMYLNRRAELEAWDIEQEFRRAFAN